jgi:hypothetical protein
LLLFFTKEDLSLTLFFKHPDSAAGRRLAGLKIDPETMLVATLQFVDNHADICLITNDMKVLDIGYRGCLERSFRQHPGVVRIDVAGVYTKAADL